MDAGFAPDGTRLGPQNQDLMFTIEECAAEVEQHAWPAFVMNEWSEAVVADSVAQRLWERLGRRSMSLVVNHTKNE